MDRVMTNERNGRPLRLFLLHAKGLFRKRASLSAKERVGRGIVQANFRGNLSTRFPKTIPNISRWIAGVGINFSNFWGNLKLG